MFDAHLHQHLSHSRSGGADPDHDDLKVLKLLPDNLQCVEESGYGHDGGSVLVVVEDRDVQSFLQPILNLEAPGSGDVFKIDPPEDRLHLHDGLDDFVHVGGVEANRYAVHVGELLEKLSLPLHHGNGRLRPDVPEPQDRRSVRHDRDRRALDRQSMRILRVLVDGLRDPGNPGGVRHRELVAGPQGRFAVDLQLATEVQQKRAIGDIDDLHSVEVPDVFDDRLGVTVAAGVDRDVADEGLFARPHDVDCPDVSAGLADHRGDTRQHSGTILNLETDGDRVAGTGEIILIILHDVDSGFAGGNREKGFQPEGGILPAGHYRIERGRPPTWKPSPIKGLERTSSRRSYALTEPFSSNSWRPSRMSSA